MKIGKKSRISSQIWDFSGAMIGQAGIGKTSTVFEMFKKLGGEDCMLYLNIGKEDGIKALEGVPYINVDSWDEPWEEESNTAGFVTVIDSLVEERTTSWEQTKIVILDTLDEMVELSREEVIRMHNRQHPDKKTQTIRACMGGYRAGEDLANKLILDELWRLKKVGISFFLIAHTRLASQVDLATGEEYSQLSANLSARDFNAFKTKLDYLCVAYMDREIVKEKSKKDPKKTIGTITSESRKVVFRSDDFSIDSKSRFADIVPEVPLDADAIIGALQSAIDTAIKKAGGNLEERKKEDEARLAKRQQEIAEAESEHKKQKEIDTIISKIKDFVAVCKEKKDGESVKGLIAKAKELGYEGPYDVSTIEDAKALLAYIKTL